MRALVCANFDTEPVDVVLSLFFRLFLTGQLRLRLACPFLLFPLLVLVKGVLVAIA